MASPSGSKKNPILVDALLPRLVERTGASEIIDLTLDEDDPMPKTSSLHAPRSKAAHLKNSAVDAKVSPDSQSAGISAAGLLQEASSLVSNAGRATTSPGQELDAKQPFDTKKHDAPAQPKSGRDSANVSGGASKAVGERALTSVDSRISTATGKNSAKSKISAPTKTANERKASHQVPKSSVSGAQTPAVGKALLRSKYLPAPIPAWKQPSEGSSVTNPQPATLSSKTATNVPGLKAPDAAQARKARAPSAPASKAGGTKTAGNAIAKPKDAANKPVLKAAISERREGQSTMKTGSASDEKRDQHTGSNASRLAERLAAGDVTQSPKPAQASPTDQSAQASKKVEQSIEPPNAVLTSTADGQGSKPISIEPNKVARELQSSNVDGMLSESAHTHDTEGMNAEPTESMDGQSFKTAVSGDSLNPDSHSMSGSTLASIQAGVSIDSLPARPMSSTRREDMSVDPKLASSKPSTTANEPVSDDPNLYIRFPYNFKTVQDRWNEALIGMCQDNTRYTGQLLRRAKRQKLAATEKQKEDFRDCIKKSQSETASPWYMNKMGCSGDDSKNFTVRVFPEVQKPVKDWPEEKTLEVAPTIFKPPKTINVPFYKAYSPVGRSHIVQSDTDLLFWPEQIESREDFGEEDIRRKLHMHYTFRMVRWAENSYIQRGKKWQPYVAEFLEQLGLDEHLLFRFLIDDTYDEQVRKILPTVVGLSPTRMNKIRNILKRGELKNFSHPHILHRVKQSQIARTETCDETELATKFTLLALVHLVMNEGTAKGTAKTSFIGLNPMFILSQSRDLDIQSILASRQNEYSLERHFEFACRICHQYPCHNHGLESLWDYRKEEHASTELDPMAESTSGPGQPEMKKTGRSRREEYPEAEIRPLYDALVSAYRLEHARRPVQRPDPSQMNEMDIEFRNEEIYHNPSENIRQVKLPCNHEGPCVKGVCRCIAYALNDEGNEVREELCEKGCGCPPTCPRRFRGCTCARKGKPCSSDKCPCVKEERECDPDLCGTCGVFEVLDPQNRDKEFKDACRNAIFQTRRSKRTLVGPSTTHGFGLFAGEDIKKGDFVGEYVGAKSTWKQAERSGVRFGLGNFSYLFDVNSDQTVDAGQLGNKMRFINGADRENLPNLDPKTRLVNTEHRMGFLASRDLKAGDEFFFNYGDNFFADIALKTDDESSPQKAKVTRKAPTAKQHGGKRANSGRKPQSQRGKKERPAAGGTSVANTTSENSVSGSVSGMRSAQAVGDDEPGELSDFGEADVNDFGGEGTDVEMDDGEEEKDAVVGADDVRMGGMSDGSEYEDQPVIEESTDDEQRRELANSYKTQIAREALRRKREARKREAGDLVK